MNFRDCLLDLKIDKQYKVSETKICNCFRKTCLVIRRDYELVFEGNEGSEFAELRFEGDHAS